jgi:leucyl/phenylalanyl-tRNA--protein transferase
LFPDRFDFPNPSEADTDGLLAVSTDLHPQRLVEGYKTGVFPWLEEEGHFLWYSPDPRMVLFPDELKIHKSMRSVFNQHRFRFTINTCFGDVVRACAQTPRAEQTGTWISPAFQEAYTTLHHQGLAHSAEVWQGDQLVGGLYGVLLGRVFFGESMFSTAPNASKAGFIVMVRHLALQGVQLIDCQQETGHLTSLGARTIPRKAFLKHLAVLAH